MNALDAAILGAALAVAVAFRPWQTLRAPALRTPWIAALVLLSLLWAAQVALPARLPVQLSGACLLVLMFGWPLAVATLAAVAAAGAALGGDPGRTLELAAWTGAAPATLALALGMATRRWLPRHLFVYILGRAFIATALAMGLGGMLRGWLAPPPAAPDATSALVAYWLFGWGEAFLTGGLAAVFVAFRPQWLLTYSDARYLPPRLPGG